MIKSINILIFLMIAFVLNSYSQVRLIGLVSFNYSYGIPTGALNTFIPHKSFQGANFDYRHFFKKDFSLGIHVGWNSFKKILPRAVYDTDKGTVSAVQTKYFYSFPILITGYYYLRSSHYVMPYIGGGIGLFDVNYRKWYGVVPVKKEAFYFGLSPEIGAIFPFKNSGLGILVNCRYNHVFYSYSEINNLRYFEANVGVYVGNF